MDTAFVITWSVPFPGRERQALELAGESEEFWGKMAAEGRCSQPEWFFFPNGTGMWMVKGEAQQLWELAESQEGRRLRTRGALLLQDWRYSFAESGAGAQRFMTEYAAALDSLG